MSLYEGSQQKGEGRLITHEMCSFIIMSIVGDNGLPVPVVQLCRGQKKKDSSNYNVKQVSGISDYTTPFAEAVSWVKTVTSVALDFIFPLN